MKKLIEWVLAGRMVLVIVAFIFLAMLVIVGYALDTTSSTDLRKVQGNNVLPGSDFGAMFKQCQPYQIDEPNSSNTYMRFSSSTGLIGIVKISVSGTVTTFEKAKTNWTARTTATYVGIND